MNKIKNLEKDKKIRMLVRKNELSIVLFKYGILMNKEKKFKNVYFLNFIKKFHLNWSSSRIVNRCLYTSRAHWPLRKFRLSRMMFKNLFDENEGLMGVKELLDKKMRNFLYADFIARLNNAKRQRFKIIKVNNTKKVIETLRVLLKLNIIRNFSFIDDKNILVTMKYLGRRVIFKNLKLVSTPGKRIYVDLIKLAKLKDKSNCSFFIISTPKGLKTDFECYIEKLCGEILLKIEL